MASSEPILLTGASGMLAGAFRRITGPNLRPVDHRECDITSADAIERAINQYSPGIIINCAAYTDVDGAEREPAAADALNGHAVANLARAAKLHAIRLIHFSTDFVFDGTTTRPYRATDPTAPRGAYGRSKLLGEQLLAQINPPDWLIIRTSWLFGSGGKCFPATIVRVARAGKPLRVVNDQVGRPTLTDDLAAATLSLIGRHATGIHHVANTGQTNWHDFAAAILKALNLTADLQPISSADWQAQQPQSARRPTYSVLDTSATEALLPTPLPPWQRALAAYRDQVAASQ
jgi:dTDP-4-dehydrorhamnose reductase